MEEQINVTPAAEEQKEEMQKTENAVITEENTLQETVTETTPETTEGAIPEATVGTEQPEENPTVEEEKIVSEAQTAEKTGTEPEETTGQPEMTEPKVAEPAQPEQAGPEMTEPERQTEPKKEAEVTETAADAGQEAGAPEEIEIPEIPDDLYDNYTKQQVVECLEEFVKEEDVNKIKKQVSLLRLRFNQLVKEEKEQQKMESRMQQSEKPAEEEEKKEESGENEENAAETPAPLTEDQILEKRFHEAFQQYKENKQKYNEEQERIKQQNLEAKQKLLEKLKELIDSEISLKEIYDQFKAIQEEWKNIGPVPQANVTETWQNYHFFVEKFFDKVKINKELKELDWKKNLESKITLCEKAEALLLEPSIFESFNLLQQYHNEWKEIGPVPDDKKEEIWARFKNASDMINQKRREHYEQMAQEQENNYQAKLALCLRAEEITKIDFSSMKVMNEVSNEAVELLKTWKTIGPAPKQHNDEIWARFKTTLDQFFERKKEAMQKIKGEQVENYNRKLNLCIQAEAIAQRKDWKKATEELLNLQKEWKEIGFVAKKQSDAIWKRFRKACDDFFAAKEAYFSDIEAHEKENQAAKEALIQKVIDTPLAETREADLEIIKAFQREWTAIGYTPIAEKERLWKEFRAAIDRRFEQLRNNENDMRRNNYQQHIQNILGEEHSNTALKKEKQLLENKIAKMKEEVTLWENNLGFFANSKNADLLKAEFEKKIEKSKEKIKELEENLKLLKDVK